MAALKICGLTRVADLRLALRLGAGRVGVVVDIPRSPRSLPAAQAVALLRCAVGRGVVVAETGDMAWAARVAAEADAAAVQLHAGYTADGVADLAAALGEGVEVWVGLSLPVEADRAAEEVEGVVAAARELARAGAARVVLDSRLQGVSGGTGVAVCQEVAARVVTECPVPVLLAGGITLHNAAGALRATGAWGLDVSSGVERSPGVKDPASMRRLVEALDGA